jgi:hypothetical protein
MTATVEQPIFFCGLPTPVEQAIVFCGLLTPVEQPPLSEASHA